MMVEPVPCRFWDVIKIGHQNIARLDGSTNGEPGGT